MAMRWVWRVQGACKLKVTRQLGWSVEVSLHLTASMEATQITVDHYTSERKCLRHVRLRALLWLVARALGIGTFIYAKHIKRAHITGR